MDYADEYRMAGRFSMAGVDRVSGRPRFDWVDGVMMALRKQRDDDGSCT